MLRQSSYSFCACNKTKSTISLLFASDRNEHSISRAHKRKDRNKCSFSRTNKRKLKDTQINTNQLSAFHSEICNKIINLQMFLSF